MSKSRPSERLSANQYQKLSAEVRKLKPKHGSIPLRRYWTLGGKVMQLGSRYGEDRVRKLAEGSGWGHAMLYACLRFRRFWPKNTDLDRVVKRGLTFGHIRALSHKKLTPREREKLERFVKKEQPSTRELVRKVRELTKGRPRPKKRQPFFDDLGAM